MIEIVDFDGASLVPGESRSLTLLGDGPFTLTNSCFVDNPSPPGFRPCAACGTISLAAGEAFNLESDWNFWRGKTGKMVVEITDSVGTSKTIQIAVLPDRWNEPGAMTMGA